MSDSARADRRILPPTASALSVRSFAPPLACAARRHSRHGLTLIEVVMGLTIIGTTALAGLAALLFCYRTADSNLRALTALGAARTVAEQVVALNYDSLFEPRLPVDLPASNVGSLEVGTWNERSEDFRNTPDKPGDDLLLSLKPEITRITDTGRLDYAQVVINYSWQERSFFRVRTRADSITMLVTPISFF